MPSNIRVHELAKELGLTNKETIDLCTDLGIGVKTHSSSIVEPQADRVRRKADALGMRRAQQPDEARKGGRAPGDGPAPVEQPAPGDGPADLRPAGQAPQERSAPRPPGIDQGGGVRPEPATTPAPPAAGSPADPPPRPVRPATDAPAASSSAPGPSPAPPAPPRPDRPPAPPARPGADRPVPAPQRPDAPQRPGAPRRPGAPPLGPPRAPVRSSGSQYPPRPAPTDRPPPSERPATPAARPVPPPPQPPVRERPIERPSAPAASAGAGAPPSTSPTDQPIPPPPGAVAPVSSTTGKPIPPPPGMGGRGPMAPRRTGPGGPSGPPGPGGPTGARTSGVGAPRTPFANRTSPSGPGGGGPSTGGGPGGRPGFGGGPGGPPGGGGRGAPNRRAPRRSKGRRRRSREELQPIDMPTYTSSSAPVPEGVTVIERASTPQELGPRLNRTAADVVRFLMQQGEMVTATQSLNDDMIELFAAEVAADIRLVDPGEEQEVELQRMLDLPGDGAGDGADGEVRPPVITIMGHVDHGKTKLLDRIRSTNVVAGEAGGITQHIGAYQIERDGRLITFIDTPGHEAFTAMRARGAEATDIVVLVVAADDGVMPQTVEALNHARAADVPIVVAINKIDRENADPNRVMQQLSELGLIPEGWGGDTVMVEVSAIQDLGIDDLLENLLVVADLEELRANPQGRAQGVVLEANLDVGRGPVATVLVQRGTLQVGDPMVAGAAWGRVRALVDDTGAQIRAAGPSKPVQVLGLSEVARAGDSFVVAPEEKIARNVADTREHWQRVAGLGREAHAMSSGARLEDIFDQIQAGEAATLNLILKADVTGSLEALTESLRKLERDEVKLSFVHRAVGGIAQSDVQLAATSNATIIGFNVRPDRAARELAEQERVEVRTYEIIYQILEDIENAVLGLLRPVFEEVVTGDAEVREIFSVPRVGRVAGCYVQNGTITRNSKVRFLREGTIIWKGTVSSLRRFKDDVREVQAGFECGIGLSDFQDLKRGDVIETFEEREIPRT